MKSFLTTTFLQGQMGEAQRAQLANQIQNERNTDNFQTCTQHKYLWKGKAPRLGNGTQHVQSIQTVRTAYHVA